MDYYLKPREIDELIDEFDRLNEAFESNKYSRETYEKELEDLKETCDKLYSKTPNDYRVAFLKKELEKILEEKNKNQDEDTEKYGIVYEKVMQSRKNQNDSGSNNTMESDESISNKETKQANGDMNSLNNDKVIDNYADDIKEANTHEENKETFNSSINQTLPKLNGIDISEMKDLAQQATEQFENTNKESSIDSNSDDNKEKNMYEDKNNNKDGYMNSLNNDEVKDNYVDDIKEKDKIKEGRINTEYSEEFTIDDINNQFEQLKKRLENLDSSTVINENNKLEEREDIIISIEDIKNYCDKKSEELVTKYNTENLDLEERIKNLEAQKIKLNQVLERIESLKQRINNNNVNNKEIINYRSSLQEISKQIEKYLEEKKNINDLKIDDTETISHTDENAINQTSAKFNGINLTEMKDLAQQATEQFKNPNNESSIDSNTDDNKEIDMQEKNESENKERIKNFTAKIKNSMNNNPLSQEDIKSNIDNIQESVDKNMKQINDQAEEIANILNSMGYNYSDDINKTPQPEEKSEKATNEEPTEEPIRLTEEELKRINSINESREKKQKNDKIKHKVKRKSPLKKVKKRIEKVKISIFYRKDKKEFDELHKKYTKILEKIRKDEAGIEPLDKNELDMCKKNLESVRVQMDVNRYWRYKQSKKENKKNDNLNGEEYGRGKSL